MGLLAYLISLAILGLVMGALARLALPGPDPMGIGQTILVGIGGSLVAGIIGRLLFRGRGGGFILAALCFLGNVYLVCRSPQPHVRGPTPPTRPRSPLLAASPRH